VISVFPPYQQKQVRMQLAAVIKGIVSQRLVARADGAGRIPAVEVMLGTLSIREAIIDDSKTRTIPGTIAQGQVHYGMQTFDQSLLIHHKKGLITYEEALLSASNPDDFALKVKGIQSTSDLALEQEEQKKTPLAKGATIPGRPGGPAPKYTPKTAEAREYTGGSQDSDFKIDRFGEK
jgi:twitching motility protein PilT